MSLGEIRVEIPRASAGAAENVLLELGDSGWSVLEDALGSRAWLVGVFGDETEARHRWEVLREQLAAGAHEAGGPGEAEGSGGAPVPVPFVAGTLVVRTLADADWRDSYKAHFKAWTFGPLHWVPVWERGSFVLPDGHAVLWLDPGLAFGTGNHETTRLCIERLVALPAAPAGTGRGVIDAGCGSGILALSAVLLGYGPVRGFDIDPEAVRVSLENAALNGLEGRVEFSLGGLAEGLTGVQEDVVMANIQSDILSKGVAELLGAVAPGGFLILSGILAGEVAAVRAVFERGAPGWAVESRTMGEWSDLLLERPKLA